MKNYIFLLVYICVCSCKSLKHEKKEGNDKPLTTESKTEILDKKYKLTVFVLDSLTGEGIASYCKIVAVDGVIIDTYTDPRGNFNTELRKGINYSITFSSMGYYDNRIKLYKTDSNQIHRKVLLNRIITTLPNKN